MNRTSVLILQHRRERAHPFNTARIVRQALDRCRLMAAHNVDLSARFDSMTLAENVGLLYPGEDARLLTELSPAERPTQLVVVDGTWHHAKTLLRDIPRLRTLPRYRLAPSSPGRYRIRREPHAHALSTVEAVVAALTTLEPETVGLDRLLAVFDGMITDQLDRGEPVWRKNRRRRQGAPNVPRALAGDPSKIVVAYGEQERGKKRDRRGGQPKGAKPIYWTAMRLVSGERFECAIASDSFEDESFLKHLRLTPAATRSAVSVDTFRDRWRAFLRPDDHLAVYHPSTASLLENVDAKFSPALILKSIHTQALDQARPSPLPIDAMTTPDRSELSRASERLASAVAIVQQLNLRYAEK